MRKNLIKKSEISPSDISLPFFSDVASRCSVFNSLIHAKAARTIRKISAFLLTFSLLSWSASAAEIVLIIDDMGNKASDKLAFELPPQVAFAILPHTPYSQRFANQADTEQRDVLIHMPMEAQSGLYMGKGGISADMDNGHIKDMLAKAHQLIPNAIGVNNHMGSKLTQLTLPMQATMEYLTYHRMFFVDSRTTRFSKAQEVASNYGVPSLRRHVFIDHIRETSHIDFQFRRLVRKAKKTGFAVGIAHPHKVTLDYLLVAVNALEAEGVTLINLSDKIKPRTQQWVWSEPGQVSR